MEVTLHLFLALGKNVSALLSETGWVLETTKPPQGLIKKAEVSMKNFYFYLSLHALIAHFGKSI